MAEDRDVSSLPLAEATIKILQAKGFHYVKDIHDSRPLDLSKELGVSAQLALSIVQSAQASNVSVSSHSSAKVIELNCRSTYKVWCMKRETLCKYQDLLEKRGVGRPIISFCRSMDQMMGGGIPIGQIVSRPFVEFLWSNLMSPISSQDGDCWGPRTWEDTISNSTRFECSNSRTF